MIGCEQGAGGAVSGTSGGAVWRDSGAGSVEAHRVTNASEMGKMRRVEMFSSCSSRQTVELHCLVAVKLLF